MNHNIPQVYDQPAIIRLPFNLGIDLIALLGRFLDGLRQTFKHAITGSTANDKIIGKGSDVLNI